MFPATISRVEQNTSQSVNDRIRRQTHENVRKYGSGDRAALDRRLAELDQEWDIERCLETMAPSITLLGLFLGVTTDRRWLALPFVVQAFFLQHALQGWCPPLPILRSLGIRTTEEIEQERYALKALRGDFQDVNRNSSAAFQAATT